MSRTNLDFTASDRAIIARTHPKRWLVKGLMAFGVTVAILGALSEIPPSSASQADDPAAEHHFTENTVLRH